MDRNEFRYCMLLLVDDYNHSKIFISEKSKYYIKNEYKSIQVKILNKFKDIRKSHEINVIDISDDYYENDKDYIIRHCTFLLIDDDNHSKIFISEEICTIVVMLVVIIMVVIIVIIVMMIMIIVMMIIVIIVVMMIIMLFMLVMMMN